ncbi:MAG: patatin-like phospholipase family protein [Nitrospiraceae bacterium]
MRIAPYGLSPHSRAAWSWTLRLVCLAACLLATTACTTRETRTYDIRQRAFFYAPDRLAEDYKEEFAYIAARRQKMSAGTVQTAPPTAPASPTIPPQLTGLAFSGGGIRSATFHLGLLQALQDMGRLSQIDYLSTVSGGSYIAGWLAGHLGADAYDEYGNLVRTDRLTRMLDSREDFVAHLRHHSGFLREDGFWEGPALVWGYLWRLPAHLLVDVALHFKGSPNVSNYIHLFTPYQQRIEATYLRGQRDRPMTKINGTRTLGPYLILNSNLVNRGRPRSYPTEDDRPYRDHFNFEFTKHFTGSDGIGYVDTQGFGLPVQRVLDANREPAADDPRFVEVLAPPDDECGARPRLRPREDYCLRLSEAMTASGAGLNVASLRGEWVRDDVGRTLIGIGLAPFNFNNQFEAYNFARRWNGLFGGLWDYARMMTVERLFPDTRSRWLEITDGSFYDNLGAQTLLRRNVSHLIVGDATLDPHWDYHYLRTLQERVRDYFGDGVQWCGEIPATGDVTWYRRFWVQRPAANGQPGGVTILHYLKPFVENPTIMTRPHWFRDPDRLLIAPNPEASARGATVDLREAGRLPGHLDVAYLQSLTYDPHVLEEMADGVKKVTMFAQTAAAGDFPQTETLVQWFTLEEFEAYRYLGYLMGWAYGPQMAFDESALTPTAKCTAL